MRGQRFAAAPRARRRAPRDRNEGTVNHRYFRAALCACVASALTLVFARGARTGEDLWAVLREGGKVVLMRHAPVERGADAGSPLVRDPSCKGERNLSSQGKRDAQALGRRFAEQRISISGVFHSPFCRTAETAHLVFDKASPAEYLSLLEILGPGEAASHTETLSRVIGSYSGNGNLVLVTHEPNISAVSFELMNHLDFLVIEPKGGAEFEELGVVRFSREQ